MKNATALNTALDFVVRFQGKTFSSPYEATAFLGKLFEQARAEGEAEGFRDGVRASIACTKSLLDETIEHAGPHVPKSKVGRTLGQTTLALGHAIDRIHALVPTADASLQEPCTVEGPINSGANSAEATASEPKPPCIDCEHMDTAGHFDGCANEPCGCKCHTPRHKDNSRASDATALDLAALERIWEHGDRTACPDHGEPCNLCATHREEDQIWDAAPELIRRARDRDELLAVLITFMDTVTAEPTTDTVDRAWEACRDIVERVRR